MIEIRVPSGNFIMIHADTGDILEFYVESYGQGLIDQDNLHAQSQGVTVCDSPKNFQAINASPHEMHIKVVSS